MLLAGREMSVLRSFSFTAPLKPVTYIHNLHPWRFGSAGSLFFPLMLICVKSLAVLKVPSFNNPPPTSQTLTPDTEVAANETCEVMAPFSCLRLQATLLCFSCLQAEHQLASQLPSNVQ